MTDDHATRIRQALWAIETAWDATIRTTSKPVTSRPVGRNDYRPVPDVIPASVLADRAEVLDRLASWALVVADDLDLHPTMRCPSPRWHVKVPFVGQEVCGCRIAPGSRNLDHRLPADDARALCRFLMIHADYLASHEAVEDVLDELMDSRTKVLRIADPAGPLEFVGRCEVCEGDLRAHPGRAALCRDCGAMVDAASTREQLVRQADDKLMTAAEIVKIAHRLWDEPVTHVRINRWANSGNLASHGSIRDGEREYPLYRVGDIAPLLARMRPRRAS